MNIARNNEILRTTIDQDGILRLTLNNQHNHNALSEEMMSNIQVALEESINNKKNKNSHHFCRRTNIFSRS